METITSQSKFNSESLSDQEIDQRLRAIRGVIKDSGLTSDSRHEFRLTPDRLVLDQALKGQFEQIGELILSTFAGTKIVFDRARKREYPDDLNRFIVNALGAGIRRVQRATLDAPIDQLPLFFRADCVLALEPDGGVSIKATEVEGERAIAFGFATFIGQVNEAINQLGGDRLVGGLGVGAGIRAAISASRFDGRRIGLILGEDQLFYLPEQTLFVRELTKQGIAVELVRERQVEVEAESVTKLVLPSGERTNLAVSLPVFNQAKSGKNLEPELLRLGFTQGRFDFLLPPFKFFGTKSPMALVQQALIRDFFAREGVDLGLVERYFPPTKMIAGQISEVERLLLEMGIQTEPPTFIKAVGMTAGRGMVMPDDKLGLEQLLEVANKKDNQFEYITQQFVKTAKVPFRILGPKGQVKPEEQFMRLAAFFANINGQSRLLGVEGTGLPSPFVHGNPNCIFFPVVFSEEKI